VLEPLDIFKMQKTYVWTAAAETFQIATSKIEQLATIASADHTIHSQMTAKKKVIPLDAT
jgi:hypothetical protein